MSVRCSVFIGTSLDGFIARKDGSIDWLPAIDSKNDFGFNEFFDNCDVIVMGRHTYEGVLKMAEWPYDKKRLIVLSHHELPVPDAVKTRVEVLNLSPEKVVKLLTDRGLRRVYVDGGRTIQSFLDANLIDDMTITTVPVLIGEGIPLFGPLKKDIKVTLLRSEGFTEEGYVQKVYRVVRPPS